MAEIMDGMMSCNGIILCKEISWIYPIYKLNCYNMVAWSNEMLLQEIKVAHNDLKLSYVMTLLTITITYIIF